MTFELTAKTDSVIGLERSTEGVSPSSSIAAMGESHRAALLGALDTYESRAPKPANYVVRPASRQREIEAAQQGGALGVAPSLEALAKGREAGGGFKLAKKISQGGVGEVWEARQVSLHRVIAVKKLRKDLPPAGGMSRSMQERLSRAAFVQEALIAASLAHPNIIPVYDLGVDEKSQPLLAMKLVEGRVWADVLDEDAGNAEALNKHLDILLQVCNAVAFAHSRHVIHRDLKPTQVMLGEYGEVLLMDWGLSIDARARAEIVDGELPVAPPRDEACSPAGTPVYMAPEQVHDTAEEVGARTDVYLLGGILYEILTGDPPHLADTVEVALELASAGNVEHPNERLEHGGAPSTLCEIAMRALSRRPEDRYDGVKAFSDAIERFQAGESRRAESQKLVEQSLNDYQRIERGEYMELARIDANLTRALVLWPENVVAAELRQRVLREYAAAAVAAGDLRLAQLLGMHFNSSEDLRDLRSQVNIAERQRRRHARQRRLLIGLLTALAMTLLLGGWTLYTFAEGMRRKAEQRESVALDAANNAIQSLASGMARPLAGLAATSRVEEAERVARMYRELAESLPPSPRLHAGRARAQVSLFEFYRAQGLRREATLSLLEALGMAREAVEMEPAPGNLQLLADIHLRVAELRAENHETEQARSDLAQATELIARLRAAAGASAGDPELAAGLLELERAVLLAQGKIHLAEGDVAKALPLVEQSVEIARQSLENANAAGRGGAGSGKGLDQSLAQLAGAYERLNDPAGAAKALDELIDVAERRASASPDDPGARRDLAAAYRAMHDFLARFGQIDEAEGYLRRSLDRDRQLAEERPEDLERKWSLAAALLAAASFHFDHDRSEAASGELKEARALIERVASLAPAGDQRGPRRLLRVELLEARAVANAGDPRAARDLVSTTMSRCEELRAQNLDDVELLELMGEILSLRGKLAAAVGDIEEAQACYGYWTDLEGRYLAVSRDPAQAELKAINVALAFVSMFEGYALEIRLERQLPIMARASELFRAFEERGSAVAVDATRLRPAFERLRRDVELLRQGRDPRAAE